MLERIWLIPVLPVAGALVQLLFGRKLSNRAVSLVSVGLPGLSFAWALGCFFELLGQPEHTFFKTAYSWLPAGPYHLTSGALANLNVNDCPAGIAKKELDLCVASIQAEACNNVIDDIQRLAACRTSELCLKKPQP